MALNEIHELNRACWNAISEKWQAKIDRQGVWRACPHDPGLVLDAHEMRFLTDIPGRDVCVLGSGDNLVVFALAGMGARVTSVDISDKQLEIARQRAGVLGLEVTFVRTDVTDLESVPDAAFDLVYTGGHVSVWVSDLRCYYAEAARILRPFGTFIVNEYHPVRRMWHGSDGPAPCCRYFARGPREDRSDEGLPQIEFNWTAAEHVQAVIDAGFALVSVEEYGEGAEDDYGKWVPPALPTNLFIAGAKR